MRKLVESTLVSLDGVVEALAAWRRRSRRTVPCEPIAKREDQRLALSLHSRSASLRRC